MNTISKAEQISRGTRAASLLEDPLLIEVLAIIENEAITKMVDSQTLEAREEAWNGINAVKAFKKKLTSLISNGKFEQSKVR